MRPSKIIINKNSLIHNINLIKQKSKKEIIGVVKANAYGLGAIPISKILRREGIQLLAVAFLEEAIELRKSGDDGEILLMISPEENNIPQLVEFNLQVVVSSMDFLNELIKYTSETKRYINVHIYVNTGMNRDGIRPNQVNVVLKLINQCDFLNVVGILTHFANSDSEDNSYSKSQFGIFRILVKQLEEEGYLFKYIHSGNSGSIFNMEIDLDTHCRPGISLYGFLGNAELAKKVGLKPILKIVSKVLYIQQAKVGEDIGYDLKFIAQKEMSIAAIPIGYGDGYPRSLSNIGFVEINNQHYPIVGTVCMDQILVDISNSEVKVGDDVVLINDESNTKLSVYTIAINDNTIVYEFLTRLNQRLPRLVE